MRKHKILIATGGTGGHIFPAQALAKQLLYKDSDVLFVGGGLRSNKYFKKEEYLYHEVASSSPFKGNILKAWWNIIKGISQSLRVMAQYKPDVVIGFGSFYSFPVLVAAKFKKIPIILFEPNAMPGKVNRLFSRWAVVSTLQFKEAESFMKGRCVEVKMQVLPKKIDKQEAREYFYLDPHTFTFLVFGGSQGAESINQLFSQAIISIGLDVQHFQVIHITGKIESAHQVRSFYESQGVKACVKVFEEQMDKAWSAADYVVCRSGAWTVAEQMAAGVPALFIPFPKASDNHQTINARSVEKRGGATVCEESKIGVETLKTLLKENTHPKRLEEMRSSMASSRQTDKPQLSDIIYNYLRLI